MPEKPSLMKGLEDGKLLEKYLAEKKEAEDALLEVRKMIDKASLAPVRRGVKRW